MIWIIGIPVVIAALAFVPLRDRYEEFAHYFFTSLQVTEQVALLALLFAVMFAAIGISQAMSEDGADGDDEDGNYDSLHGSSVASKTLSIGDNTANPIKKINYPLHEMNQAHSDRSKFTVLYPWLREAILTSLISSSSGIDNGDNHASIVTVPEAAVEYISKMMDYTVMGGKFNRGTTVVSVYRVLREQQHEQNPSVSSSSFTPYELCQAATLGWTVEFLQAFFLVADDVMDESELRRGVPCWYQNSDVQLKAVNDAFLLESFVFTIVQQFFSRQIPLPSYTNILELLLGVIQKTELGQLLDLTMPKKGDVPVDFGPFTMERYQAIVRYKTAYYSFYLPVALAMSLAGITHGGTYRIAEEICGIMGEYFQIQDDVTDCYGSPRQQQLAQLNKDNKNQNVVTIEGTDIQDNKCTWLIVQALQRCNEAQRQILEDNYGQDDEASIEQVKQVYKELELQQAFQTYQEQSYDQIQHLLDKLKPSIMPREVFRPLLKKLYKSMNKN